MRLYRYIGLSLMGLAVIGMGSWFLVKRPSRLTADVAAMVNGRPIAQALVAETLSSANLNQSLTTPGRRQALTRMILESLIEEELALAAAEEAGLTAAAGEVAAWAGYFEENSEGPAFSRVALKSQDRLHEVIRRRILISGFMEWLSSQNIPTAADWRNFAASWGERVKTGRYLLRVIILPDLETARVIREQPGRTLEALAAGLKKNGQPVLLSPLFWMAEESMTPDLLAQVKEIKRNPDGLTFPPGSWSEPLPLAGHQAVYELAGFAEGRPALEELGGAVLAFEAAWRERAYQRWLAAAKARARIQLNSDLDLAVSSLWAEGPDNPN